MKSKSNRPTIKAYALVNAETGRLILGEHKHWSPKIYMSKAAAKIWLTPELRIIKINMQEST